MKTDLTKPNAGQRAMIARGYGMFIHFGVNTFNQTEWSEGNLPASSYNPTQLDCDQWIRVAKEAGFRHVVLVTKHHDGFCLWPAKNTEYSVASSPVKTDVVGEVAKACRKYGVQLGLYYSLWDRHEPTHREKDSTAYVAWMKDQLTELLTNYGDVCELWFDGGWAKPSEAWKLPEVYAHVKKMQPNCQVTVNLTVLIPGEPDSIRQPTDFVEGDPLRYWPVDFRTKDPAIARWDDPKLYTTPDGQKVYLPFEHTICISERWNWFQKKDILPARPVDELEQLFYWGTQGDHILIVNLPPDQTGRLRANEVETILALADRLGIRGGEKPLPRAPENQAWNCPAQATSTWPSSGKPLSIENYEAASAVDTSFITRWASQENVADLTLSPQKPFVFNRVVIHEYPDTRGMGDNFSQERVFRVQAWSLEARSGAGWREIAGGTTLGAVKTLDFIGQQNASELRLRILKASAPPSIYHIGVYNRGAVQPR